MRPQATASGQKNAYTPVTATRTLVSDNFDDGTIDTVLWSANSGSVSESGGQAVLPFPAGSGSSRLRTGFIFPSVRKLSVSAEIVRANSDVTSTTVYLQLRNAIGLDDTINVNRSANSNIGTQLYESGVSRAPGSLGVNYDASHDWWRIREFGGNFFWDTSADGVTWTTHKRFVRSESWPDAMRVTIDAESSTGSPPADALIDNVLVEKQIGASVSAAPRATASGVAVGPEAKSGSASMSASARTTATGQRDTAGSASATAAARATATGQRGVAGSASATAASRATASGQKNGQGTATVTLETAAQEWAVDQASLGAVTVDSGYGGTPAAFTTDQPVAANGWVFVVVGWYFSANLTDIDDGSLGLTWTLIQTSGSTERVAIARAFSESGFAPGQTFTPVFSTTDHTHRKVGASSYVGGDADSFDAAGIAATGSTAAWETGDIESAGADELILGAAYHGGWNANTPTSPAVEDYDQGEDTTAHMLVMEHRVEASPDTYTLAGTAAFDSGWAAIGLAMAPAVTAAVTVTATGTAEAVEEHSGSASVSARPAATATGQRAATAAATASAAARATATGTKNAAGAATCSARPTCTATGQEGAASAATASNATPRATATGQKGGQSAATCQAAARVTASGAEGGRTDIVISARATATATGTKNAAGAATCQAATRVTATGAESTSDAVTVSARPTATASGQKGAVHEATVSARPRVTATIADRFSGEASAQARATCSSSGVKGGQGTSAQSAAPRAQASGQKAASDAASVSAAATVTAAHTQTAAGSASMSAAARATGSGAKNGRITVGSSAGAAVSASGAKQGAGRAAVSAHGTVTAVAGARTSSGASSATARARATASGAKDATGSAQISAAVTVTATPLVVVVGTATVSAAANVTATGGRTVTVVYGTILEGAGNGRVTVGRESVRSDPDAAPERGHVRPVRSDPPVVEVGRVD